MSEYHPELSTGRSDDRPLRSRKRQRRLRVLVLVVVAAMVLPGVLSIGSMASNTAQRACVQAVQQQSPGAVGAGAQFEWFGPGFIGWECYGQANVGGAFHVTSLGLIPSAG